jgi:hypothetical protein
VPGALLVAPDPFYFGQIDQIVSLAAHHRIPALYPDRRFAPAGGLIIYASNPDDLYRTVGITQVTKTLTQRNRWPFGIMSSSRNA